jgi:hypothetical protein
VSAQERSGRILRLCSRRTTQGATATTRVASTRGRCGETVEDATAPRNRSDPRGREDSPTAGFLSRIRDLRVTSCVAGSTSHRALGGHARAVAHPHHRRSERRRSDTPQDVTTMSHEVHAIGAWYPIAGRRCARRTQVGWCTTCAAEEAKPFEEWPCVRHARPRESGERRESVEPIAGRDGESAA